MTLSNGITTYLICLVVGALVGALAGHFVAQAIIR